MARTLRPYQETAAQMLLNSPAAMVLAPVGAGKTCITLTAISRSKMRFLVIAPLRVADNVWAQEAAKWAPDCKIVVATGDPRQRAAALASDARIVVINYDNLIWLAKQELNFDGVVFDELTKLKDPGGQRFKALFSVINNFNVLWGLTGSFTSNGLEDVFGQCKIINKSWLGRSKGAFLQTYFTCTNPDYGEWKPRRGALERVMERIKPYTFVLDPGDYKDKLPPLHEVDVDCEMNMAHYNTMKAQFVLQFPNMGAIAATSAAVVIGKLQQIASGFVYGPAGETVRLGSHKFDALDNLLEENQHANTIVVYQYKAELEELLRRYPKAGTVKDIEAWNRGEVPLLLLHPKSAGHGLNLQHGGHHIVFLSLPWSLELYEQVIGRLLRSGQTKDVWCYRLMTRKTVDYRILDALKGKTDLSELAMEALC